MSATPQTASPEALENRRKVLELTGWGLPFRLWQPHNLCFWIYAVCVILGVVGMIEYFAGGSSVVGAALAAGSLATALYGLIFVLILRRGDHYERQPRNLALTAFVWGAVAATFLFAITANNALLAIYPKLFGQAFGADWGPPLTAPFTEETSKAAGFILLMGLAPRLVRSPYDGVFLGAFIGLGFQLFEDVLYDYNSALAGFGADQVNAALGTFGMRAASGIFSHALYSAIFCCGIIYAVGTPLQPRRLGLGIGLMALAMVAHGTWDAIGALSGINLAGLAGVILFSILALALLFAVMRRAARPEREYLRTILQPEVERGTITQAELDAACASRKERRHLVHAGKGHKAHHAAKHVIRATMDLGHEIAEARGGESPGVEHERAEIARLRTAPTG